MTRTIAIASQKGGVGKTTTSINLACGWARRRGPGRVLLIDIDPQANATAVLLGLEVAAGPRQADRPTIREVLQEEAPAAAAIQQIALLPVAGSADTRLDLLPSHLELATVEAELTVAFRGEHRLRRTLESVTSHYEIIIIDCPPSLGILTLNALAFAGEVIVPVDPGLFPLIGLNLLVGTIEQVKEVNPRLHLSGVMPTMTMNTVISRETVEQLRQNVGSLILPEIPRRVAIEESHVSGADVFGSAPTSDGAAAYQRVIEELEKRG